MPRLNIDALKETRQAIREIIKPTPQKDQYAYRDDLEAFKKGLSRENPANNAAAKSFVPSYLQARSTYGYRAWGIEGTKAAFAEIHAKHFSGQRNIGKKSNGKS